MRCLTFYFSIFVAIYFNLLTTHEAQHTQRNERF